MHQHDKLIHLCVKIIMLVMSLMFWVGVSGRPDCRDGTGIGAPSCLEKLDYNSSNLQDVLQENLDYNSRSWIFKPRLSQDQVKILKPCILCIFRFEEFVKINAKFFENVAILQSKNGKYSQCPWPFCLMRLATYQTTIRKQTTIRNQTTTRKQTAIRNQTADRDRITQLYT